MAFPWTVDPASPAGSDSPRLGDNQLRDLKQLIADLFTLPVSPSTISATMGTVSTAGKFTLTNALWNADAVTPAYGGTGVASYTIGDILYASGATTLSKLADVATGNVLISGGVSTAPSYGKVALTTHVSGVLPTANGGTGIAYFTAAGPTVARVYTFPDAAATILYSGGSIGTPSGGTATNLTGLPLSTGVTGTLPVANGGTSLTTLTANNVILGNGTSAPSFVAPGTNGNVLTSNGTTWTSAAASGVTITAATATVATAENTTSATYTDLATAGASVTVTIGPSGNALVFVSAITENTSSIVTQYIDFDLSSGNTRSATDTTAVQFLVTSAGHSFKGNSTTLLSGLTSSSTVFTMKYRRISGTATFSNRTIAVLTW